MTKRMTSLHNHRSPLNVLDSISQENAVAAAAAAAAACNNDPNKFQELLLEKTKALVAAEALKNSEGQYSHKCCKYLELYYFA